jgi:hypothetical protein
MSVLSDVADGLLRFYMCVTESYSSVWFFVQDILLICNKSKWHQEINQYNNDIDL